MIQYYFFVDQAPMLKDNQEQLQSAASPFAQREGAVLMICDSTGRIVFVHGDPSVFQLKHSKMIQSNLFSLGFTLFSLLQVSKTFPHGILGFPSDLYTKLRMELLSRKNLRYETESQSDWEGFKHDLIKVLRMSCSLIKATFSHERIEHKEAEVLKRSIVTPKQSEAEEELVLIEIQLEKGEIKTRRQDYEYTRKMMLQEMKYEEMN